MDNFGYNVDISKKTEILNRCTRLYSYNAVCFNCQFFDYFFTLSI